MVRGLTNNSGASTGSSTGGRVRHLPAGDGRLPGGEYITDEVRLDACRGVQNTENRQISFDSRRRLMVLMLCRWAGSDVVPNPSSQETRGQVNRVSARVSMGARKTNQETTGSAECSGEAAQASAAAI